MQTIQTKYGTFTITESDQGVTLMVEKVEATQRFNLRVVNKTNDIATELCF